MGLLSFSFDVDWFQNPSPTRRVISANLGSERRGSNRKLVLNPIGQ